MPKKKAETPTNTNEHIVMQPIPQQSSLPSPTLKVQQPQDDLYEYQTGTSRQLSNRPPSGYFAQHEDYTEELIPDSIGQPLTKDLLRIKDRIDQVADDLLRAQHEQTEKRRSIDLGNIHERHSIDFSKLESEARRDRTSSVPSSPRQQLSSHRSSMTGDNSSVVRTDKSEYAKSSIDLGSRYISPSEVNSGASQHDLTMNDTAAIDPIWLQVPTWSSKSGLMAMLYKAASRCIRSRMCEQGQFLTDISSDDIIEAAQNIRTLHDYRNDFIREHALHQEDKNSISDNARTGSKLYASSVHSMSITPSCWNDIQYGDINHHGAENTSLWKWNHRDSHASMHLTSAKSISSQALSDGTSLKKILTASSQQGICDNIGSVDLPPLTRSRDLHNDYIVRAKKLKKLGIVDQPETTDSKFTPNLRFEHTSLHFLSRTNKLRLYLWTFIGNWYVCKSFILLRILSNDQMLQVVRLGLVCSTDSKLGLAFIWSYLPKKRQSCLAKYWGGNITLRDLYHLHVRSYSCMFSHWWL